MNERSFMPPTPRSSAAADDKPARLLEAALDLFETRGYDGVAVPEIAARAGVATGTIYRYFRDKAALVNALYRHWKARYNEALLAPLPALATPRESLGIYWRRMTEFARAHPRAMRFLDLHHHAPYLDTQSQAMSTAYRATAEKFVRDAKRAGAIRDVEPAVVVALLWGAALGLVKFAQRIDEPAARAMEDALWRALATEPETGESHGRRKTR